MLLADKRKTPFEIRNQVLAFAGDVNGGILPALRANPGGQSLRRGINEPPLAGDRHSLILPALSHRWCLPRNSAISPQPFRTGCFGFGFGFGLAFGVAGMKIRYQSSPCSATSTMPYFSPRKVSRPRGSAVASSCHVRTLQRIRRSTGRTHFITAYQPSISSGLRASVSTQKAQPDA